MLDASKHFSVFCSVKSSKLNLQYGKAYITDWIAVMIQQVFDYNLFETFQNHLDETDTDEYQMINPKCHSLLFC